MTTTILPVPTILNILNDSSYFDDQNVDVQTPRAKKRRLDHLSWEEKIQRKKLKNRVAAQTSRDRKKAKLEQMETAIQQLFNKNESIIAECKKLREANERLQAENSKLKERLQYFTMPVSKPDCRVRAREWVNRISPSAERNGRLHSSGFGQHSQESLVEDPSSMPSLPDLLDELESDAVDLNALEQLTQTLLQDIARDLENAAQKTANQEPTSNSEDISGEVVGSSSKQLESRRGEVLKEGKSVEQDISEYLLLHHNYAKAQPKDEEEKVPSRKSPSHTTTRKLKKLCPNLTKPKELVEKSDLFIDSSTVNADEDFLCRSDANTITIYVNDDSVSLNEFTVDENEKEIVSEASLPMIVDDCSNSLSVPVSSSIGSSSPRSDLGYESLDSPLSCSELDSSWDASVTELFPSLF